MKASIILGGHTETRYVFLGFLRRRKLHHTQTTVAVVDYGSVCTQFSRRITLKKH